ncbi:hypothetical protein WS70_05950 [Burkholderia mayonis]|uniref:Uncharacterized protein n=1 Tax=Burkholderia mayonis TaxID=1385591 RepID=A0A1B4FCL3_9BURK|nr:hypothetical protein WS70_05950 [Burkholderia mayonis]KVE34781.1 hypothetical protein WS69_15955 [Burkholderia sp. BDU5]KVE49082.1 hypothetical protein WS70_20875 [Burkholderia mayonis]
MLVLRSHSDVRRSCIGNAHAPTSVRSTRAEVVLSMQHDKLGHPFLRGAFGPATLSPMSQP